MSARGCAPPPASPRPHEHAEEALRGAIARRAQGLGEHGGTHVGPLHRAPASTPSRRFMETLLGVPRVWANMETRSSSAIHRACVSAAAARAS